MGTTSYIMSPISYSSMKMALETGKVMVTKAGGQKIHTDVLDTFVESLVKILDACHGNLELIHKNEGLSRSGKAEASLPYFVKSWNALDDLAKANLDERDIIIDQLKKQITPRPFNSGNPIIDELRAAEIRKELKGSLADVTGRMRVRQSYLDACQNGNNPLLCHALETAPGKAFLTTEDIEKGKMLRAKSEHPQQVRDLEIYQVLRVALDYPYMHSKRILKNLGMPIVELDWGRIALQQIDNSKTIRLVSMRKYIMHDVVGFNKTTEMAAAKAGLHKQPWDDDNSLNLQ